MVSYESQTAESSLKRTEKLGYLIFLTEFIAYYFRLQYMQIHVFFSFFFFSKSSSHILGNVEHTGSTKIRPLYQVAVT